MKGTTATIAAGLAARDSRARRLMKDATSVEGRCDDDMKMSRRRKKRGRYRTCRTERSRRE